MMREILFRGKRIDNGEWVYGLLWKKKYNHNKLFISYFPNEDDEEKMVVVAPETVGQYTGLKDKNGKKIFEEDVVRLHSILFVVKWRKSEFYLGHIEGQPWSFPYIVSHAEDCEVIGNIHDNPELLEVKHESD